MRRLAPFLVGSTLFLAGCGVPRAEPKVEVDGARITLPAVKGRPGAAYFTLTAAGLPERLTAVSSPRVQRIELHESMASGMGPLKDGSFPGEGRLSFEPGGKHAMLFGLDPALKVGDRIPLTLSFERAPAVTVEAEVLGPGGATSHAH
jgi:copper(I)-binding protein